MFASLLVILSGLGLLARFIGECSVAEAQSDLSFGHHGKTCRVADNVLDAAIASPFCNSRGSQHMQRAKRRYGMSLISVSSQIVAIVLASLFWIR